MREVFGTGDFIGLEKKCRKKTVGREHSERFSDCGQLRSVVAVYSDLILNKETVEIDYKNS
jgi:hypothetical protein